MSAHKKLEIYDLIMKGDIKGVYAEIGIARTAGDLEAVRYIIQELRKADMVAKA